MSKVVFSMTEQQYDVVASIANGHGVPYKPRAWSTAYDLERKGWITQDGRGDTYRLRFKLTPVGMAIVGLVNSIAAAAGGSASANGSRDPGPSASAGSGRP